MYRVCWSYPEEPTNVFRSDPEKLKAAVERLGFFNAYHPESHHWIESVDNPNVLVKIPSEANTDAEESQEPVAG